METRYIVELEPGVYISGTQGDPGRTLRKDYAKRYKTAPAARGGLTRARRIRPFVNARLIPVVEKQPGHE